MKMIRILAFILCMGLFNCASAAIIVFTLTNNTGFTILPDQDSAGLCTFDGQQLVCRTDKEGNLETSVPFSIDGVQNGSAPTLWISTSKGEISIFPTQSKFYGIQSSVSPTTWHGKQDNDDGNIIFSCPNYFCQLVN